jgi:Leucine-rich repeat (LRR) protein
MENESKRAESDSCSTQDSLALVAIYNKMNGDSWYPNDNWLTTQVKDWEGITVLNHRVTGIDLSSQGMSTSIAEEIWDLTGLTHLNLEGNNLDDTIPDQIQNLSNLIYLNLGWNQLYSSIPPEIGSLLSLQYLNLEDNNLTDSIPPEIGNLTNLDTLNLWRNYNLGGPLPPEIENLTNLSYLNLYMCPIGGEITPELLTLNNLTYLNLQYCGLSGTIPPEIENMASLTYLNLRSNSLSDTIPSEIGNLSNLTLLDLFDNDLTGKIPSSIWNLTNLNHLDFGRNDLTDSIPAEVGNLTNLTDLRIRSNHLFGSIPSEIGLLTNLEVLELYSNELNGAIPPELNNLTALTELRISNNLFDSLPDLSAITNLEYCNLNNNLFDFADLEAANIDWSSIPYPNYSPQDTVFNLDTSSTGEQFTMSVNVGGTGNEYVWLLNGEPYDTTSVSNITVTDSVPTIYQCKIINSQFPDLTLETNSLYSGTLVQGVIEKDYNALVALYDSTGGENWYYRDYWLTDTTVSVWHGITTENYRVVEIQKNSSNLTGEIPAEFWNLTELKKIYFQYNNLTGTIPTELETLTKLDYLNLSANEFSGSIPPEIGNLPNMEKLYLRKNQLTGSIPPELGNLSNLESLLIEENSLSDTIPSELTNATNLWEVSFSDNNLTGALPEEFGILTNLISLSIHHNKLDHLPDMSSMSNLSYLYMNNNYFDFGDLENASLDFYNFYILEYSPQDTILKLDTSSAGNDYTLTVNTGGTGNEYTWLRDGNPFDTTTVNNVTVSQVASYSCQVKNSQFPDLTLNSETITLGEYTVTFNVTDESSNALEAAVITIEGGTSVTTNSSGVATLDTVNGTYNYTVTKTGYNDASGSITVSNAPISEAVTLTEVTYTVTFNVTDEGSDAIEGATVSITGEEDQTTNSSGVATFDLTNGTYDYTVTADGYEDASGNFTVSGADITEDVSLSETVSKIDIPTASSIKIYPNPASETLNIESKLEIESIRILTVIGEEVMIIKPESLTKTVNISSLRNGLYLIQLNFKNEPQKITKRLIVK